MTHTTTKTARPVKAKEILWEGDENRPLQLVRPCSCGCDARGGLPGVGYLTGSTKDGKGVSIWIEDEAVYRRLRAMIGGER